MPKKNKTRDIILSIPFDRPEGRPARGPEAEWERLTHYLKTEGSVLAQWFWLWEAQRVFLLRSEEARAQYVPRRAKGKRLKMRLFLLALREDAGLVRSRATFYREIDCARRLLEKLGRSGVSDLVGTTYANHAHFLRALARAHTRDARAIHLGLCSWGGPRGALRWLKLREKERADEKAEKAASKPKPPKNIPRPKVSERVPITYRGRRLVLVVTAVDGDTLTVTLSE